jgi:hypothetical protein
MTRTWSPKQGAIIARVLDMLIKMGAAPTTTPTTTKVPASHGMRCFLPRLDPHPGAGGAADPRARALRGPHIHHQWVLSNRGGDGGVSRLPPLAAASATERRRRRLSRCCVLLVPP